MFNNFVIINLYQADNIFIFILLQYIVYSHELYIIKLYRVDTRKSDLVFEEWNAAFFTEATTLASYLNSLTELVGNQLEFGWPFKKDIYSSAYLAPVEYRHNYLLI